MKKPFLALFLLLLLLFHPCSAELLSLEEMTATLQGQVRFTIPGMPLEEYQEAATTSPDWITILVASEPGELNVDLSKKYTWSRCEELLRNMAAHDNVHLDVIGQSVEGRRIYSVRVGRGERSILLVAGVQAKEIAGTMYVLKQLSTLINLYSRQDARVTAMLDEFSIIAVPCINPDGRALLEDGENIDWRANASGVDLSMNFPCANAGQEDLSASSMFHSTDPASADYPGPYLGSEPETKALIGWLEEHIAEACALIQYEQYGRYVHSIGDYLSEDCQQVSDLFAQDVARTLSREDALYSFVEREEELRGWSGGTVVDFAAELAEGLTFSSKYGRLGLNEGEGAKPLSFFGDIDECAGAYLPRTQTPIACISIDISTKGGIGYHANACRNQEKEYENCGYNEFLIYVMEYFAWWSVAKTPEM